MDNEGHLDNLLNGEPTEAPAEVIAETASEPETIGQPRGPDGKFLSTQETGVETPATEPEPVTPTEPVDDVQRGQYAALKDERRKRQEAEARAADLEAKWLQAQRQAQPQEAEIDFWDNPQAVIGQQFQQFKQQLRQELRQEQITERIDASEVQARSKYADYDDALHAFRQAVQANPTLAQQMTASPDPAEFAYKKGKTALDLERVGSIDDLLKSERAKWEAEARAAMPAPPTLPATTAADGSVGGRSGPAWAGPGTVNDYLR